VEVAIARRTLLPMLLVSIAMSLLTPAPADDASDLRAIVEKFYALYAKKDLDGFMTLWSEKSPDYAFQKQTTQELFTANDYTFTNLAVLRVKVENAMASLRVAADSTSTHL